MSWRQDYRPGSFRGVPFVTTADERGGGRRNDVHELPGAEEPVIDDLGGRVRSFSLSAFVIGNDYFDRRDALIDALEAGGPGLLVHPYYGRMQVVVDEWTVSQSTDDGGMASFEISFIKAGEPPAVAAPDPMSLSLADADSVIDRAIGRFADGFTLGNLPDFVEAAAGKVISGIATVTQLTAMVGGGAGGALRAFETGLAALGGAGLLHAPLSLAHSIVGLVQTVGLLGGNRRRIDAFGAMLDYNLPPVPGPATPSRMAQQANQDAALDLYHSAAAAELTRTIALTSFASQDDALAVRDAACDRLDTLRLAASDASADMRAADYGTLARAIVRDIGLRAPQLATLRDLDLVATEPAIVIANRLYGHDLAAERADDIADRNAVRQSAFVAGGQTIRVIANG